MDAHKLSHALVRLAEISGYIKATKDQRRTPNPETLHRWSLAIDTNVAIIRGELNITPATTTDDEHRDLR